MLKANAQPTRRHAWAARVALAVTGGVASSVVGGAVGGPGLLGPVLALVFPVLAGTAVLRVTRGWVVDPSPQLDPVVVLQALGCLSLAASALVLVRDPRVGAVGAVALALVVVAPVVALVRPRAHPALRAAGTSGVILVGVVLYPVGGLALCTISAPFLGAAALWSELRRRAPSGSSWRDTGFAWTVVGVTATVHLLTATALGIARVAFGVLGAREAIGAAALALTYAVPGALAAWSVRSRDRDLLRTAGVAGFVLAGDFVLVLMLAAAGLDAGPPIAFGLLFIPSAIVAIAVSAGGRPRGRHAVVLALVVSAVWAAHLTRETACVAGACTDDVITTAEGVVASICALAALAVARPRR